MKGRKKMSVVAEKSCSKKNLIGENYLDILNEFKIKYNLSEEGDELLLRYIEFVEKNHENILLMSAEQAKGKDINSLLRDRSMVVIGGTGKLGETDLLSFLYDLEQRLIKENKNVELSTHYSSMDGKNYDVSLNMIKKIG